MKNLLRKRKIIFDYILKLAKSRKSPDWTMKNLDLAIAKQKRISQEIFRAIPMNFLKVSAVT